MDNEMIQVSERDLMQRINKILAREYHKLFKSRTERERQNMGDWYVAGTHTDAIIACHCDLEAIGRETGALKLHECVGRA